MFTCNPVGVDRVGACSDSPGLALFGLIFPNHVSCVFTISELGVTFDGFGTAWHRIRWTLGPELSGVTCSIQYQKTIELTFVLNTPSVCCSERTFYIQNPSPRWDPGCLIHSYWSLFRHYRILPGSYIILGTTSTAKLFQHPEPISVQYQNHTRSGFTPIWP